MSEERAAVEFVADTDSLSDGLFYIRKQERINQQTLITSFGPACTSKRKGKIARQMPNFRGENEQKFGNLLKETGINDAF